MHWFRDESPAPSKEFYLRVAGSIQEGRYPVALAIQAAQAACDPEPLKVRRTRGAIFWRVWDGLTQKHDEAQAVAPAHRANTVAVDEGPDPAVRALATGLARGLATPAIEAPGKLQGPARAIPEPRTPASPVRSPAAVQGPAEPSLSPGDLRAWFSEKLGHAPVRPVSGRGRGRQPQPPPNMA